MSPVWFISRSISPLHLCLTFFINPLPSIRLPASLPLLSSLDTTILEPTSVKNYLNWQETCFLSTWLEDGFKGKVLLYNVWKFCARSFSHWRVTTIKTYFSQYLSIGYKTGLSSTRWCMIIPRELTFNLALVCIVCQPIDQLNDFFIIAAIFQLSLG